MTMRRMGEPRSDVSQNPIRRGVLPAGTEFVVEGNGLMRHSKLEAAAK